MKFENWLRVGQSLARPRSARCHVLEGRTLRRFGRAPAEADVQEFLE
jgi:hypothetical protein